LTVEGSTSYLNVDTLDIKDNKIALNANDIQAQVTSSSFTLANSANTSGYVNLISTAPTTGADMTVGQYILCYVSPGGNPVNFSDGTGIDKWSFNAIAYDNSATDIQISVTNGNTGQFNSSNLSVNNFLLAKDWYLVYRKDGNTEELFYTQLYSSTGSITNLITVSADQTRNSGVYIYTGPNNTYDQCFQWHSDGYWEFKNTSGSTDGSEYGNVRVATTPSDANDATSKNYVDTITTVPTSGTANTNITTALSGLSYSAGYTIDNYIGSSDFSIVFVTKNGGDKKVVAIQDTTGYELN